MSDNVVYFDLETTGLNRANKHRDVEIVSIGAVADDGSVFHQLICPNAAIEYQATKVHGFTNSGGILCRNGRQVSALSPEEGMEAFLDFLLQIKKKTGAKVILVAHNASDFDSLVLCHNLIKTEFTGSDAIGGFICTLKIAQSFPEHGGRGMSSLNGLLQTYCGRQQSAVHDALQDARDLKEIVSRMAEHFTFSYSESELIGLTDVIRFSTVYNQCLAIQQS